MLHSIIHGHGHGHGPWCWSWVSGSLGPLVPGPAPPPCFASLPIHSPSVLHAHSPICAPALVVARCSPIIHPSIVLRPPASCLLSLVGPRHAGLHTPPFFRLDHHDICCRPRLYRWIQTTSPSHQRLFAWVEPEPPTTPTPHGYTEPVIVRRLNLYDLGTLYFLTKPTGISPEACQSRS